MAELHDVQVEVGRARDRLHELEKSVVALELLYGHQGRRVDQLDARVGRVEHQVGEMTQADEIADAVQARLHEHRSDLFSWWQKGLGLLLVVANLVALALGVHAAAGG